MSRRQQSMDLYAALEQRYPEYLNIVDVLGGYSRHVRKALKQLVGDKSDTIALQIRKSVITGSVNIANIILK